MQGIWVKDGLCEMEGRKNKKREISERGALLSKAKEVISRLFRKYYSINEAIKVEGETEEEKELNKFLNLYICVLYRHLGIDSKRVQEVLKSDFVFMIKGLMDLKNKDKNFIFDGKNFWEYKKKTGKKKILSFF